MNDYAFRPRRHGLSRQYPDGSRSVFLFRIESFPDLLVELLQKISGDLNKSRRELFLDRTTTGYGR